jgi:hypothetical protein
MSSVFISGSIAIKNIPNSVEHSIDRIINKNIKILVGDADGVDTMVQNYCKKRNYYNVIVYSISNPRYKVSGFENKSISVVTNSKKERERQQEKDSAMTIDSDYSLAIWDGKSKGSYQNILRAIKKNKKIKVFLSPESKYLHPDKITNNEISFIFRKNNGYTAKEVVEYLQNENEYHFKDTRQLNNYLLQEKIIKKETVADDKWIYKPMSNYEKLFIIDRYRGKVKGIKFNNNFIDWVEKLVKEIKQPEQQSII